MTKSKQPKVFISYAWEEDTKIWVHDFATRLRSDGVDTILDQWHVIPGDSLPEFMEKSVSESDFVLVICTPAYKRKSESEHPSGVVYEKGVITGELFVKRNQRKFIPILQKGKWRDSAPSWGLAKTYIDLSDNPYSENNYIDLLRTIYKKRETAPPLGTPPNFKIESTEPRIYIEEKVGKEIEQKSSLGQKYQQGNVSINGDVSSSVILTGNNNVINRGMPEESLNTKIEDIKNFIEFGKYEKAHEKCVSLSSQERISPIVNLLAGIAYYRNKRKRMRGDDWEIVEKHISIAIQDEEIRPTALAVLGCIKYVPFHLSKLHDSSSLTLQFIKEELQNYSSIDKELLELIDPVSEELEYLNIQM